MWHGINKPRCIFFKADGLRSWSAPLCFRNLCILRGHCSSTACAECEQPGLLGMHRIFRISVIFLLLGLAACGHLIQPTVETQLVELRGGSYELDPKHTSVIFKVNHMGFSNYVGRFNEFDARLNFQPDEPSETWLEAVVKTQSIDVNDDSFEKTLTGSQWFDSDRFPEAHFETTGVQFLTGNAVRFNGLLTLRGVTAPVALDVEFNGGAFDALRGRYVLGFTGATTIQRSSFGMGAYIPAVGDAVTIEVNAEFLRR